MYNSATYAVINQTVRHYCRPRAETDNIWNANEFVGRIGMSVFNVA